MFDTGLWYRTGDPEDVNSPDAGKAQHKPKIGIALGGGAARGWAHIGVMKALAKAGFAPEIVGGTSIGAVVGGCYSAGKLEELEAFARELSKRRMFGLMDLNFAGSGLINGNRLAQLLERGLKDLEIEGLEKRFIAIATELGTGHEIWLTKGDLVRAMRASYALPGIFKPVQVHGRWLMDGAVVNPVPVSVCRAFGARLVIAINLNTDVFGRGTVVRSHDGLSEREAATGEASQGDGGRAVKKLVRRQLMGAAGGPPGISAVMMDAFNIVQDRIARSRLAGDPPDITVQPSLAHVGLFDFHRADEAIAIGEEAMERQMGELERAVVALA